MRRSAVGAWIALFVVALATLGQGCAKKFDGDDDGGTGGGSSTTSGAGGAGGEGGDTQCVGKPCGDPCYGCTEQPCNQYICDGLGSCLPALDVTCMP